MQLHLAYAVVAAAGFAGLADVPLVVVIALRALAVLLLEAASTPEQESEAHELQMQALAGGALMRLGQSCLAWAFGSGFRAMLGL